MTDAPNWEAWAEAAACLWEEVLQGEDGAPWTLAMRRHGAAEVRSYCVALAPLCDADWEAVAGDYGDPFDLEFCPAWLRENWGRPGHDGSPAPE